MVSIWLLHLVTSIQYIPLQLFFVIQCLCIIKLRSEMQVGNYAHNYINGHGIIIMHSWSKHPNRASNAIIFPY